MHRKKDGLNGTEGATQQLEKCMDPLKPKKAFFSP